MHFEESTVPLSVEGCSDPSAVTGFPPPTLSLSLFSSLFSFPLHSLLFLSLSIFFCPPAVASLFAVVFFLAFFFSFLRSPDGTGWEPRERWGLRVEAQAANVRGEMFGFALWRSCGVAASRSLPQSVPGAPSSGVQVPPAPPTLRGGGWWSLPGARLRGLMVQVWGHCAGQAQRPFVCPVVSQLGGVCRPRGGQQVLLAPSEGPLLGASASLRPDACRGKGGMGGSG